VSPSSPVPTTILFDQLAEVRQRWIDTGRFAAGTLAKYDRIHTDWLQHAAGKTLDTLTAQEIADFATSPTRQGAPPSTATQALRLAVVDTTYSTAHELAITDNDPVARVARPRRASVPRPTVTDADLQRTHVRCRRIGIIRRAPVIVALAECGASTGEMLKVTTSSFDDEQKPHTVHLPGTARREPRTVGLTDFAQTVLPARLASLRGRGLSGDISVLGEWGSGQEGVCTTLRNLVKRDKATTHVTTTGLNRWAARAIYARTGDLLEAAKLLGTKNYTSVAHQIGLLKADE